MPLRAMIFILSCCVFPALFTAHASTVRVPQDLATIQQAIDAIPDTVIVGSGVYSEVLLVSKSIVILSAPAPYYAPTGFPEVAGLAIQNRDRDASMSVVIKGVYFRGIARISYEGVRFSIIQFNGCRFDSSLSTPNSPSAIDAMSIRACIILGDLHASAWNLDLSLNTVIGGGIRAWAEGIHAIQGNYVRGPASIGIEASSGGGVRITGNTVSSTDCGLRVSCSKPSVIRDNVVSNCRADGIVLSNGPAEFTSNTVRRCGGRGFELLGVAHVRANTVDRAQGDGIRASGPSAEIDSNTVGRCGGNGIVFATSGFIRQNTVFLNESSGIVALAAIAVDRNIAYGNGRYGLEWSHAVNGALTCNDWYANGIGAVMGASGASDREIDPMFCAVDSDDVRLAPGSPLLETPSCGTIGAKGAGCGAVLAIFDVAEIAPTTSSAEATVVVPDQFLTIQQAIDARAGTIVVRAGTYHETLRIDHGVVIRPQPSSLPFLGSDYVRVDGIRVIPSDGYSEDTRAILRIEGLHILGSVQLPWGSGRAYGSTTFESCRMDSGLFQPGWGNYITFIILVRNCMIFRGAQVSPQFLDFTLNAIIDGSAAVTSEGYHVVRGNVVLGPADVGIRTSSLGSVDVVANRVIGTTDGIYCNCSDFLRIQRNVILDCARNGITTTACGANIEWNVVQRCGGHGVLSNVYYGPIVVHGNAITDALGDGIHVAYEEDAIVNRLSESHLSNASPSSEVRVDVNVVGGCAGNGIYIDADGFAEYNTLYRNAGAGMIADDNVSVDHNIAYENAGYGLEMLSAVAPQPACNDWFGNRAGAVSGTGPGSSDLAIDPMFCDVAQDDVRLRDTSPVLDAAGCGRIGALGVGCVDSPTAALVTGFEATITAAGVRIRFEIGMTGVDRWIVERSTTGAVWSEVSSVAPLQVGPVEILDAATEVGPARLYRLMAESGSRRAVVAGPILARADLQSAKLALEVAENPVQGVLRLKYVLPTSALIQMSLFDVQGREATVLAHGPREAGTYSVSWDTGHRPAGIYFVRLVTGSGRLTRKVVVAP